MITLDSPYEPAPPFAHTSGPHNARIAIVGEAWGESEAQIKLPFVGSSGQELTKMLREAEISRSECFLTNVLAFRPMANDLTGLQVGRGLVGENYPMPQLTRGKFLHPKFMPELYRLWYELSEVRPNVVIAAGATACWALLGTSGLRGLRGTCAESVLVPGLKVLPTWHPAYVLRSWAVRPVVVADLMKARREMDHAEIRRPQRWTLVDPTPEEIRDYFYEPTGGLRQVPFYSVDIETTRGQISMLGIATSTTRSCTVPFVAKGASEPNYWGFEQELVVRSMLAEVLASDVPKIFQNGLYDLQYLIREGFVVRNCSEDTMLLHHSIYPEMEKSLGFMGSVYTNEPAWKLMRKHNADMEKKDE